MAVNSQGRATQPPISNQPESSNQAQATQQPVRRRATQEKLIASFALMSGLSLVSAIMVLAWRVYLLASRQAPIRLALTETALILALGASGLLLLSYRLYLDRRQYTYTSPEWRGAIISLGYGAAAILVGGLAQAQLHMFVPADSPAASSLLPHSVVLTAVCSTLVLLLIAALYGTPHSKRGWLLGVASAVAVAFGLRLADHYWYGAAGGLLELIHLNQELTPYYQVLDNLPSLLTMLTGTLLIYHLVRRPAIVAGAAEIVEQERSKQVWVGWWSERGTEIANLKAAHTQEIKKLNKAHADGLEKKAGEQAILDRQREEARIKQITALQTQHALDLQARDNTITQLQSDLAARDRTIQQQQTAHGKMQRERDNARNQATAHEATIEEQQTTIQGLLRRAAAFDRKTRAMLADTIATLRAGLLNPAAPAPAPSAPADGTATADETLIARWVGIKGWVLELWQVGTKRDWRFTVNGQSHITSEPQIAVLDFLHDLEGTEVRGSAMGKTIEATTKGEMSAENVSQILRRFVNERGVLEKVREGFYQLPHPDSTSDSSPDNPPTAP